MNGNSEERIFKQLDELHQCIERNRKEQREELKNYVDKNDEAHKILGDKIDQWPAILSKEKNHCIDTFATKLHTKWLFLLVIGSYAFTSAVWVYVIEHIGSKI